jgi:SWI/SNF-related matrix-associated actin-dependent regulator 1 of chromatin subfamily A
MPTDLDDSFNRPARPTQADLPLTRQDVLDHLRWTKPIEVATVKGQRIKREAAVTPEAMELFDREGPELYALGYVLGEWPRGSGKKRITKWELLPELIVTERRASVEMSRAVDAEINAPRPEGLEYLGYQRAGIAYGFQRRSCLIGDEMGLGKTIQAIGIMNCMPLAQKILVICPASLKINWRRELQKWLVRERTIFIADSRLFPDIDGIVIINYDVLKRHEERIKTTEWDLLVVDEAHLLKNKKAQRSRQVLGLEATKKERENGMADIPGIPATKKIFLTGTPIPNKPKEIWPLIHYLDPISWSSWWKFAGRFCGADQSNHWNSDGESNMDELQRRLRETVLIRRLKKDVLKELPPKTRKIVEIQPDARAKLALQDELDAFEDDDTTDLQVAIELAKAGDDKAAYTAMVNQMAGRLRRTGEDLFTLRKNTAIAKAQMPAVMDLLEEAVEESGKVIIFAHHKEVVRIIAQKFGAACTTIVGDDPLPERDMHASRFQKDPECRVIIGSFGAMGVGWTLTAASHVICFELDWVPGNVSQAEDRAHRIGQTDNVLVEHYVLEGSLDADMARRITEKQEIIDQCLDVQRTEVAAETSAMVGGKGGSGVTFDKLASDAAQMTPDQRAAAHQAIRMLASACDGARGIDGHGFNKLDAGIGRSLASQLSLTPKQAALALKICRRYAKTQLPAELANRLR